jgi:pyruvate dehydrogenase E2 component (dihydrolipoamide acetyltransferase)
MRRALERDEMGRYFYPIDEALWPLLTNFHGESTYSCSVETEIDMTEADSFRKELEKSSGVHITLNSLIVKGAAKSLEDHIILAGRRVERLDRIICPDPKDAPIGMPIQVGDSIRGVVIEGANRKGLVELAKELNETVKRIKETGEQPRIEWKTPLLVVSNIGNIGEVKSGFGQMGGGINSTLGICSIIKKPVVRNDEVVIRKMMNAIVLWDHFAMMANTPIEFLNELKRYLEEPSRLISDDESCLPE